MMVWESGLRLPHASVMRRGLIDWGWRYDDLSPPPSRAIHQACLSHVYWSVLIGKDGGRAALSAPPPDLKVRSLLQSQNVRSSIREKLCKCDETIMISNQMGHFDSRYWFSGNLLSFFEQINTFYLLQLMFLIYDLVLTSVTSNKMTDCPVTNSILDINDLF